MRVLRLCSCCCKASCSWCATSDTTPGASCTACLQSPTEVHSGSSSHLSRQACNILQYTAHKQILQDNARKSCHLEWHRQEEAAGDGGLILKPINQSHCNVLQQNLAAECLRRHGVTDLIRPGRRWPRQALMRWQQAHGRWPASASVQQTHDTAGAATSHQTILTAGNG